MTTSWYCLLQFDPIAFLLVLDCLLVHWSLLEIHYQYSNEKIEEDEVSHDYQRDEVKGWRDGVDRNVVIEEDLGPAVIAQYYKDSEDRLEEGVEVWVRVEPFITQIHLIELVELDLVRVELHPEKCIGKYEEKEENSEVAYIFKGVPQSH